jgi:hypothetical protein
MAKTKTDRQSTDAPAPQRARAKPSAEQLAKLASRRRRLQRAELELAGLETLERIASPAGPPIRRRDPIADQLAALRSNETARPDEWARFDEAAETLADELARRWRLDLAAAFGGECAHRAAHQVAQKRSEGLGDERKRPRRPLRLVSEANALRRKTTAPSGRSGRESSGPYWIRTSDLLRVMQAR